MTEENINRLIENIRTNRPIVLHKIENDLQVKIYNQIFFNYDYIGLINIDVYKALFYKYTERTCKF
jgi:hypothetical protein